MFKIFLKGAEMSNSQNFIMIVLVLCLAVSFGSHPATCWADEQGGQPEQVAAAAQLVIQGKFILSLVLEPERGQLIILGSSKDTTVYRPIGASRKMIGKVIDLPAEGETVSLPWGTYRWNTVTVYDETRKLKLSAKNRSGTGWFNLSPGATTMLTIGAPLKHTLTVARAAGTLHLDYKLLGTAGERYLPVPADPSDRPKAPDFAVYKAADKVFSGSFRYG